MMTEDERQLFEDLRRSMRDILQDVSLPLMLQLLTGRVPRVLNRDDARLVDLVRDPECWPILRQDLEFMMLDPDRKMAEPARALLAALEALRETP